MAALCSFTLTTKCGACCFFPPPKCLHPPYQPINPPPQSNTQATLSKVSFSGFLCHHHPHLLYLLIHSNSFHFPHICPFHTHSPSPGAFQDHCNAFIFPPLVSTFSSFFLLSGADHKVLSLLFLIPNQPPAHPSSKPGYYHATPTSMTFLLHMWQ